MNQVVKIAQREIMHDMTKSAFYDLATQFTVPLHNIRSRYFSTIWRHI